MASPQRCLLQYYKLYIDDNNVGDQGISNFSKGKYPCLTTVHLDKTNASKVGIENLLDGKVGKIDFVSIGENKISED